MKLKGRVFSAIFTPMQDTLRCTMARIALSPGVQGCLEQGGGPASRPESFSPFTSGWGLYFWMEAGLEQP